MTILDGLKIAVAQNKDLLQNYPEMNKKIEAKNKAIEAENAKLKEQGKPLKALISLVNPKLIKEFHINRETYLQMLSEEHSIDVVPGTAIPIVVDERAGSGFTTEYEE